LCYTPEDGISLDLLRKDVEFLRRRYELDQHGKSEGRLVIKQVFVSASTEKSLTVVFG
jgi:6-phosphofructokinase 1